MYMPGPPKVIISDRDKTLTAEVFTNLMKVMNIEQVMGTSYQHRYNGAVEVLNKTIEVMLRHIMSDNLEADFVSMLPLAQYLLQYEQTCHNKDDPILCTIWLRTKRRTQRRGSR